MIARISALLVFAAVVFCGSAPSGETAEGHRPVDRAKSAVNSINNTVADAMKELDGK